MVDEVTRLKPGESGPARAYLLNAQGRLSLPVWVDHVGAMGTRYANGELTSLDVSANPTRAEMPRIDPS